MEIFSFPEFHTKRLFLRKLKQSDWKMISYLRSDELVNRYVKRPSAETKEESFAFISKIERGSEDRSMLYWVITKNGNEEMIGSICLWNFTEDRKTAEVGYDLSPEFQNKGIMDESLKTILKYGFTVLNLEVIIAYTQGNNFASTKLLERNDFQISKELEDTVNIENVVYELRKL